MRYKVTISPAFSETNAYGHIDSLASPDWFDRARALLYREMDHTLRFHPHGLVVVSTTVFYHKEISPLAEVEIHTWVTRVGRKSFEARQEAWQLGELRSSCRTAFCCTAARSGVNVRNVSPIRG